MDSNFTFVLPVLQLRSYVKFVSILPLSSGYPSFSSLGDEDRRLAEAEARRYEGLSDAEREAIWNEGSESIEP